MKRIPMSILFGLICVNVQCIEVHASFGLFGPITTWTPAAAVSFVVGDAASGFLYEGGIRYDFPQHTVGIIELVNRCWFTFLDAGGGLKQNNYRAGFELSPFLAFTTREGDITVDESENRMRNGRGDVRSEPAVYRLLYAGVAPRTCLHVGSAREDYEIEFGVSASFGSYIGVYVFTKNSFALNPVGPEENWFFLPPWWITVLLTTYWDG